MTEIYEKWGFGMAPPKPATQGERILAVSVVLELISATEWSRPANNALDFISTVKGLFNRVAKQDQWDWFWVSRQLGYPSGRIARVIADELKEFRQAAILESRLVGQTALNNLRRLPTRRCLNAFLGQLTIPIEANSGWLYVLSCREYKDLLKIGVTTRSVEERVKEINAATGVAIPFGVRSCYRVLQPLEMEKAVHTALSEFRLRGDREFFRLDHHAAQKIIRATLAEKGTEIRTLEALTALQ